MIKSKLRNFHVPLPDELYNLLHYEAKKSNLPATELVRNAIVSMLKERERNYIDQSLTEYALKYGGTEFDLSKDMECASIEFLMKQKE